MDNIDNNKPKGNLSGVVILIIVLIVIGVVLILIPKTKMTTGSGSETSGASGASQVSSPNSPAAATPNAPAVGTGTNSQTASALTVTYTDSGFSPSTITVKAGETVTFVNQSSERMSVASNPHPTHTDYPEFDQYKTSYRGQKSFPFIFTRVGSWGYHNHLNPGQGGIVFVQ